MNYQDINAKTIDGWIEGGWEWGKPISHEVFEKAKIPTHIYIKQKKYGGLRVDSIILVEQIRAIDKTRLEEYIGALSEEEINELDNALILAQGININKIKGDFKSIEIADYLYLTEKIYSPKVALAYFLVNAEKNNTKNIKKLIRGLIIELLDNCNDIGILRKVDLKYIERIDNYWNITFEEIISYGFILYYTLNFEEKELTEKTITDMFIYIMKIYSPENAVKFFKKKIKITK